MPRRIANCTRSYAEYVCRISFVVIVVITVFSPIFPVSRIRRPQSWNKTYNFHRSLSLCVEKIFSSFNRTTRNKYRSPIIPRRKVAAKINFVNPIAGERIIKWHDYWSPLMCLVAIASALPRFVRELDFDENMRVAIIMTIPNNRRSLVVAISLRNSHVRPIK